MLADQLKPKQVARRLKIELSSVNKQIARIYAKLGIHDHGHLILIVWTEYEKMKYRKTQQ